MKTIEQAVVWITGASSGIGEALVYELAKKGANIVLSARRADELKRVQKAAGLTDQNSLILPLDLAMQEGYDVLVRQVVDRFGRIDLLVNNGGISQRSYFKDTDLAVFRRIMEVNFFGNVALTKAVLPYFIGQKHGHIAVVSSVVGRFGTPLRTAYSASKHALHGFYDALRAEHHADGLKVLLVCPGYIRTNVSINALTADGSPQGTMDKGQATGLSAEECARQILKGVQQNRLEIYPGGLKEVAGVYVKRFFPRLLARMVRKVNVTK